MEFFDKLGKKASEAYKVTADKTGKIAKEAKLRMKMSELKSQIKAKNVDEPLSITSYSLEILLRLAEQGLGVAVVPKLTAVQEILDGRLEVLNTPVDLQPLNFIAIYTQGDNAALKEKLTDLAMLTSKNEMAVLQEKMKSF